MSLPTPPPPQAGGIMLLQARDSGSGRRHLLKLHTVDFDDTYSYTPDGTLFQPTPTEADVPTTLAAFGNVWKAFFGTTWKLSLRRLFRIPHADVTFLGILRPAGVPFRVDKPLVGATTGVSVTPTAGIEHAISHLYMASTAKGGRFKIALTGVGGQSVDIGSDITANPAGTDQEKFAAYLSGPDTAIVGHDGSRIDRDFTLTVKDMNVLRRKYEFD